MPGQTTLIYRHCKYVWINWLFLPSFGWANTEAPVHFLTSALAVSRFWFSPDKMTTNSPTGVWSRCSQSKCYILGTACNSHWWWLYLSQNLILEMCQHRESSGKFFTTLVDWFSAASLIPRNRDKVLRQSIWFEKISKKTVFSQSRLPFCMTATCWQYLWQFCISWWSRQWLSQVFV